VIRFKEHPGGWPKKELSGLGGKGDLNTGRRQPCGIPNVRHDQGTRSQNLNRVGEVEKVPGPGEDYSGWPGGKAAGRRDWDR